MGTGRLGVVSGRASLTSARRDSRTSSPRSDDGQRTRDVLDRLADVVRRFHGSGTCWDQQIPLERAFAAPFELTRRLGRSLDVAELATFDLDELGAVFSQVPALHRFPGSMAKRVQACAGWSSSSTAVTRPQCGRRPLTGSNCCARSASGRVSASRRRRSSWRCWASSSVSRRRGGGRRARRSARRGGSYCSIADIASPESRIKVRDFKKAMKAAAKSGAA